LPGFGTPTVTIFGRRRFARPSSSIRAVLGIRNEPEPPTDPSQGLVWRAIMEQTDAPGSSGEWVASLDLPRSDFAKHPWTLSVGDAAALLKLIESMPRRLVDCIDDIGRTTIVGEDNAWTLPRRAAIRYGIEGRVRGFVTGEYVRDFAIGDHPVVWDPYVDIEQTTLVGPDDVLVERILWPMRSTLERRRAFNRTLVETGRPWYVHLENYTTRLRSPLAITFAEISTHNHCAFSREGELFDKTAPIVKVSPETDETAYLALLGALNASTGCFWMKQVCHVKGGSGIGRGVQDEAWEDRYAFNPTRMKQFPLPSRLPLEFGRQLDSMARQLARTEPSAVCETGIPTRERLDDARAEHESIRGRMIARN
jgi:hypothetical protein